jgi:hypothetical protein
MCVCVKTRTKHKTGDSEGGLLFTLVKHFYSHWLMKEWVRPIVVRTPIFSPSL